MTAAPALTDWEVQQIESGLGIALTGQEKSDLASIVKPDGFVPQWRVDAQTRIEANRMAELTVRVVDSLGNPIPNAEVDISMLDNAFRFGGVLDLRDMSNATGSLQISTDRYKELFLSLFNAAGLNNGFKIKHREGNEPLLPAFFEWAQSVNLPVRGHTLIWPGTPEQNHLPTVNPDLLGDVEAVEQAIANNADATTIANLKETLRLNTNQMIAEWASKWPVYEWDVINEPITNHRVQDLIGYDQMAEWFRIAAENAVLPGCNLVLNEYQIISARSGTLDPGAYAERAIPHRQNIDTVLSNGGPLNRLGFQSRFKFEHPDPQLLFDRLQEFHDAYGLNMVGTEFEVRDNENPTWFPFDFSEYQRAQITEEVLTTYYSHPNVDGLFAWTYMKPDEFSMCYFDGTVKLNALVWYYLHRIRYSTTATSNTDNSGWARFSGYKGTYSVTIRFGDHVEQATITLQDDQLEEVQFEQQLGYWGTYPVNPLYYADTGDWLGWLQVQHAPWIWTADQQQWWYVPHEPDEDAGQWIYIARQ